MKQEFWVVKDNTMEASPDKLHEFICCVSSYDEARSYLTTYFQDPAHKEHIMFVKQVYKFDPAAPKA